MDDPLTVAAAHPLTVALVGAGANIAGQHLDAIAALPNLQLVAVCDVAPAAAERLAARCDAPFYNDLDALLAAGVPDIVAITTPHPFHLPVAEAAFAAGANVLVEKPMAVTASEADAMIAAAERAGRILAVSFQHRFSPLTERLYQWAAAGELGAPQRVAISEPWLRTAAYFAVAPWRATWRGEGGGVLLNQAPHALDLLTYLLGLPRRVTGISRTLRHNIEVEDTVHAILEWEDGCIGYFTSSTTEPETGRRIELVCDRAKVVADGNHLQRTDYQPGLREHAASDPEPFGKPQLSVGASEELSSYASHLPVYADLVAAITEGRAPRCDGEQGRASLELANAIALSSWTSSAVELPLDRGAYDAALEARRDTSRR